MSISIVENDTSWRVPVSIMPYMQAFPELQVVSELDKAEFKRYDEKKVILSDDRSRLFGVYGKKSPVIRHEDLLDMIESTYAKMFGADGLIQVMSVREGAGVVITAEVPLEKPLSIGDDDFCNLLLQVQNSYDHTISLKVQTGIMRVVCTNGAIIGHRFGQITARDLINSANTNTLSAKVHRLIERSKTVTDVWTQWLDIEIPRSVIGLVLEKKFPKKFGEPLMEEIGYSVNKYDLYHLMTRRATHDTKTDYSRFVAGNIISNLFYNDYFEKMIRNLQLERMMLQQPIEGFTDSDIADSVTVTDHISH